MDAVSLLLPLFMIPGVDQLTPIDVYTDGESVLIDASVGDGRPVKDGDVATVQFVLAVGGGKELANTAARGLSYSLQVSGTTAGNPLVDVLQGMRVGGQRTMVFSSTKIPGAVDPLALKDSQLVLWVRLIGVRAVSPATGR